MARQHIHVSMQKKILFVIYNYPMTMPDKNPNTKHYKISRKTPATIDCTGSRAAQKKKGRWGGSALAVPDRRACETAAWWDTQAAAHLWAVGPMKRSFVCFSWPNLIQQVIRHSAQLLRQWACRNGTQVPHSGPALGFLLPGSPRCGSLEADRITPAFFSQPCDEAHVRTASHRPPGAWWVQGIHLNVS